MATTAIIIEDGTAKSNSNTYASVSQLTTYAADRNITLTGTYGDETEVLYKAMDFLEALPFIGYKYTDAQALQWPRYGVVIDTYDVLTTEIPQQLITAQLAIAIAIDQGFDPLARYARTQEQVKVGPIMVKYSKSASSVPTDPAVWRNLDKLLSNSHRGLNTIGIHN